MATNIHQDQFRDAEKIVPNLEPCPFCGATRNDSEIIEPTKDCFEPSLALHTWNHGEGHATYLVQCARCDAQGPTSYLSEHAIHLWNTRRPLPPVVDQSKSKWFKDGAKQEEMPLEKELEYLTREASRASDIQNHVLIVDCIRYLRDEVQKLKQK